MKIGNIIRNKAAVIVAEREKAEAEAVRLREEKISNALQNSGKLSNALQDGEVADEAEVLESISGEEGTAVIAGS